MAFVISPVETVKQLVGDVGLRHGVYTRSLQDSGVVVGDADAIGRRFQRDLADTIEALRDEFGPTGDPDAARASGVDPEVLLGAPPTSTTDSDWVGFAVWASAALWIFVAGRYYRVADASRTLLLVGVAREGDAMAARLA